MWSKGDIITYIRLFFNPAELDISFRVAAAKLHPIITFEADHHPGGPSDITCLAAVCESKKHKEDGGRTKQEKRLKGVEE